MIADLPATFAPGSLINARGRDWVVLPPSDDPDLLVVRPLGGTDDDATGLYLPLEGVDIRSASIDFPDPQYVGDAVSASLLRDAVRLGFRSAAGPLRSVGRIAVEPRPYQVVPLLMALRLDPVRLLIGDDVGTGKAVESGLIARELLDRGEIRRVAVLCPPHLCEQWQSELWNKFHLDAVVVRPGTVTALERQVERERGLDMSRTLFEEYPYTVISIDYIKSDRRRLDFVRTCPEFVIVDEAHGVSEGSGRGAQQQRHALVKELATDPQRHLVFTTATPHSGNQQAFASLVGLLVPELEDAVAAEEFASGTDARRRLAEHFVQRRRADIRNYLQTETDFPERLTAERTYKLTPAYRALLQHVLDYAREVVRAGEHLSVFQQRVSWWAALALLRCVSSSPAAAAAALRTRAPRPDVEDPNAVDRLAALAVLDLDQADDAVQDDSTPGGDSVVADDPDATERARLLRMAREAGALAGDADPKLQQAIAIVKELVDAGFQPIVFCRYIATAHYVADSLARKLRGVAVAAVTGELPPEEREQRVDELAAAERHVLVATDCLSEGINLQRSFNAVIHYDLAWNPTRHEQREGRVDRYGQPRKQVRTVLLYGEDNRVDGVVLEVLLRKADNIRKTLGISVPVPADTDKVLEAIFDELFQRESTDYRQLELFVGEQKARLAAEWDAVANREKRTRTVFAQHAMRPEEVAAELQAAVAAIGSEDDVRRFVQEAAQRLGAPPAPTSDGRVLTIDVRRLPPAVRGRAGLEGEGVLRVGFDSSVPVAAAYLERTHPLVEALGTYLLDTALDEPSSAIAKRAGAIRTRAVSERTVLLLARGRYLVRENRRGEVRELLAEEALLLGFRGDLRSPTWLAGAEVERLALEAEPAANVPPQQAALWLRQVEEAFGDLTRELNRIARDRATELLAAHQRVRRAARMTGVRQNVEAKTPLDLIGVYVLMPAPLAVR